MSISQFNLKLYDAAELVNLSRTGIGFGLFLDIVNGGSFTIKEWSKFLHLTERTIQRYKKEKKRFETIHSEKIIEIARLQNRGKEIFGTLDNFEQWMNSKLISLGGTKPIDLLDNAFGIDMVMDELGRIEHGVLA